MKKLVDGVMVTMTPAEAVAMQAEWDAFEVKRAADAAKPKEPTLAERLDALETWAEIEMAARPK